MAPFNISHLCSLRYSYAEEERQTFNLSWSIEDKDNMENCTSENNYNTTVGPICYAYIYQLEDQLGNIPYWGEAGAYSGGGYLIPLGNDPAYATNILSVLESLQWLDQYTRAVFIEFNVWNPNTNYFNQIQLAFEFTPFGATFANARIDSIDLYRYSGSRGVWNMVSEILCVLFVTFFTIRTIYEMVHYRESVRSLWNWLLIISFLLFYMSVGLYALRSYLTVGALETAMNSNSGSIELFITFKNICIILTTK